MLALFSELICSAAFVERVSSIEPLYPKVYEDYCRHFEAYNDVTGLESHVYFYGLRKGEETTLKLDEGKISDHQIYRYDRA